MPAKGLRPDVGRISLSPESGNAVARARFRTYRQAVDYLLGRVNYERTAAPAYTGRTFKLERMTELLRQLGNPQRRIEVTHIAGTKGKGSTASMLAAILTASGIKTGLFTSPHLERFEERFTVDGQMPDEGRFLALLERLAEVVEHVDAKGLGGPVTYFEIATALAWMFFESRNVDHAVLEVGLGGRLDSTNVCVPGMTIITSIGMDHMALLGNTLEQIAREKSGILKPDVPLLCGVRDRVARQAIEHHARSLAVPCFQVDEQILYTYSPPDPGKLAPSGTLELQTPVRSWSELPIPLSGEHQALNTALAVTAFDLLAERHGWATDAVGRGLLQTRCAGRFEVVGRNPDVILDVAHNVDSIEALLNTLDEYGPGRRRHLLLGVSRDKDAGGILKLVLPRVDSLTLTEFQSNPRSLLADDWAAIVSTRGVDGGGSASVDIIANCQKAWDHVCTAAGPKDILCVTGSFFLVSELSEAARRKHGTPNRSAGQNVS